MWAPVNAPFSWPNSSLSSRLAGMAAQFTLTNSPVEKAEFAWSHRASTSFPVPPSPAISTGTLVRQIFKARWRTSRITDEIPKTTSSGGKAFPSGLASFVAALTIYKDMGLEPGDPLGRFTKAFETPSGRDNTEHNEGSQSNSKSLLSFFYAFEQLLVIVLASGLNRPRVSREEKETAARKNPPSVHS